MDFWKAWPLPYRELPGLSSRLLSEHWKLYQGYVKRLNEIVSLLDGWAKTDGDEFAYGRLLAEEGFLRNAVRLHELYFEQLVPGGAGSPGSLYTETPMDLGRLSHDEYVRQRLESHREILRQAPAFACASCGQLKSPKEAAGVHLYETRHPALKQAMIDPESGKPRVGTYAICLECLDSFPEDVIHQNVTKYMAQAGLFGKIPPKV
jgi:hypothetical protein